MSVAGILSSLGSLQLGGPSAAKQGLQLLRQDLKSGDLNGAQSAFAALQQACAPAANSATATAASNPALQPTSTAGNSQRFRELTSRLPSSSFAASSTASSIKQDPTPGSTAGSPKHRIASFDGASPRTTDGSNVSLQSSLLNQIGQALASRAISAAQQASARLTYAGVQAQLSGALNALTSSGVAAESPVSMLA